MMKAKLYRVAVVAASIVMVACGAALPPTELVDAREAYARANDGEASELAPVQLEEARQALDRAENAFEDDPEALRTRDLAYVALRNVELAEAHAAQATARLRAARARGEEEEMRERLEREREAELEMTQEQLAEHRRAFDLQSRELEERERELAEREQALEREREARQAAEAQAAAAIESLQRVAAVQEEERGLVITLSGAVLFASGQSDLLPIAQQKLDQVAETLNDSPNRGITIEGHTDSRGSRRRNEALSLARANSVRDYLVSKGVDANRIRAVGLGSERPVANNRTAEGRANNRRVEIVVAPEE
jgi:outer membrane protein OmpA-like peptidoglycan-associated protein